MRPLTDSVTHYILYALGVCSTVEIADANPVTGSRCALKTEQAVSADKLTVMLVNY